MPQMIMMDFTTTYGQHYKFVYIVNVTIGYLSLIMLLVMQEFT